MVDVACVRDKMDADDFTDSDDHSIIDVEHGTIMYSSPVRKPGTSLELLKAHALITKQNKKETERSWSTAQEDLLFTWVEKSAGYRWLHTRAYEHYTLWNNMYTYPIVVLSTVAGFGGFVFNKQHPSAEDNMLLYVMFSLNLVVAVLSSLQKLNRFAEQAEKHLSQSIQYAKFYREINMELSLERKDRENGIVYIKNCKYAYDNLLNSGGGIPTKIIRRFNRLFPNVMNRPDIANGLFDLNCKTPKHRSNEFRMDSLQVNLRR